MAITCVFGMTQSGKSYYVENKLLGTRDKKLVFDSAHCFKTGTQLNSLDLKLAKTILMKKLDAYNYVYRPGRREKRANSFEKIVSLSEALGRMIGPRDSTPDDKRLLLVADEADSFCQPGHAAPLFTHLVNEGRHDNVDSLFICRDPHNLFIDARKNASKVVTFFNPLAHEMPFFTGRFGKVVSKRISNLPRFHYVTWSETGNITFTDENGKIYETIGR